MTKSAGVNPGRFEETHWSLIGQIQDGDPAARRGALDQLLQSYSSPLLAHLKFGKRLESSLAEDMLQGFVADRILEKDLLSQADPTKGRFRSLLLKSLDNYLRDRFRRERARQRAEEKQLLQHPLRETEAERQNQGTADPFVAEWARQIVSQALKQMHTECHEQGLQQRWEVFVARILRPLVLGEEATPYEQLVQALGLDSPVRASNVLMTAKRQFRRTVRSVIWQYSIEQDEVDAEIADLQRHLLDVSASDLGTIGRQLRPAPAELSDDVPETVETSLESLAELLVLPTDRDSLWPGEDMAAILRHQMSLPLASALAPCLNDLAVSAAERDELERLSFNDLLEESKPSLDVLRSVKQLARSAINDKSSALPTEIATVLYFGSIALARVRLGQSITNSEEEVVHIGVQLLLRRPWIEGRLRDILGSLLERLSDDGGTPCSA